MTAAGASERSGDTATHEGLLVRIAIGITAWVHQRRAGQI
jgi:hypothetical protein